MAFRYFFQAYFSASFSFNLSLVIFSIAVFPKIHEFTIVDGLKLILYIFSAKNINNVDEKDIFFLSFISFFNYSSLFVVVPAGDNKTNLFTFPGYFSQNKVAIYPPKLCPTNVNSLIFNDFLHSSIASTK